MPESKVSMEQICEEIQELRTMYKHLIDRLVPLDEPTEEERQAIQEVDKIETEEELRRALGLRN